MLMRQNRFLRLGGVFVDPCKAAEIPSMSAEKKRRLDALLPVFEELEVCEAIWC